MEQLVYVLHDARGMDDPGTIEGVFLSLESAQRAADKQSPRYRTPPEWTKLDNIWGNGHGWQISAHTIQE